MLKSLPQAHFAERIDVVALAIRLRSPYYSLFILGDKAPIAAALLPN